MGTGVLGHASGGQDIAGQGAADEQGSLDRPGVTPLIIEAEGQVAVAGVGDLDLVVDRVHHIVVAALGDRDHIPRELAGVAVSLELDDRDRRSGGGGMGPKRVQECKKWVQNGPPGVPPGRRRAEA